MNIDVDGRGFTEKVFKYGVKGDVTKIDFNSVPTTNVVVNGNFKAL
jgi:hypothetical protein